MYPLILIRHAQAEHHIQEITGGWSDTDLTREGIYQSMLLAARLRSEMEGVPACLVTSNLRRAMHTATIIGQTLGIAPQIQPALADLNNGIAAGKTHAEAKTFALPPSEPILDWKPYPEAESWRQFFDRVSLFIDQFNAPLQTAAILVTHSANIHVIIAWWLQLSIESRTHFEVAPASITVLKQNQWGERAIERLNDVAHLYTKGDSPKLIQL